ncbi:MAG TPA: alpha/beta hydrolase-fold protein [Ktedonobacterales bacterium]|nr:alpha/beta hydrolase-fold protein [Ktedonobacterales bacterium]
METRFWRLLGSSLALGAILTMALTSSSGDANAAVFAHKYDGYLTRTYTDKQGASMTCYLYVPRNYNPRQSYPLVLLLHGGGERGEVKSTLAQNRSLLLNDAYANVWSSLTVQRRWPSFIVVPQIVGTNQWVNTPSDQGSYQLASEPTGALRLAKEIVDALQREYQGIGSNRLYITGLSMGGYGTWDAIERWPTYFAAAAPIAGAGDPTKASVLTQLPIWAFHGAKDVNVPVSGSRDMIQAIRAAGGQPSYTEYPQAGHDIWMQVYTSSDFLSWLFAQRAGA